MVFYHQNLISYFFYFSNFLDVKFEGKYKSNYLIIKFHIFLLDYIKVRYRLIVGLIVGVIVYRAAILLS